MKLNNLYFQQYDKKTEREYDVAVWNNLQILNYNTSVFFFFHFSILNLKFESNAFFSTMNHKNFINGEFADISKSFPQFDEKIYTNFYEITDFFFLRRTGFISFFIENMIDVPICFKKSKSLKSRNFELTFLKFTNLLMRHGKKEKTFKQLNSAFFEFLNSYKNENFFDSKTFVKWRDLFFFLNNSIKFMNETTFETLDELEKDKLALNNLVIEEGKLIQDSFFVKNYFQTKLCAVTPVFSYFIYNVDKNIRKFSRGKSGKYVFVWKYIAPYKRSFITFRWILKDVKFNEKLSLQKRLEDVFKMLIFDVEKTFVWKSKKYAYSHVFKNFRRSLMSNLKTITK